MKRQVIPGLRRLHCRGVTLAEVHLLPQPGQWSPVDRKVVGGPGTVVIVESRVRVPPGDDQIISVKARVTKGDTVLAEGEEWIEGEEGGTNWDDGVPLSLRPPLLTLPAPHLFIEIEPDSSDH